MSTSTRAFVLAGMAVLLAPGISTSEDTAAARGYLVESYPGSAVVTGGFGQCWHTSYWNGKGRIEKCDPETAAADQTPAAAAQQAAPVPAPAPEPAKTAQENTPPVTKPLQTEDPAATPLPAPVTAAAAPQSQHLETALLPQTVHYSTDAFFDFDEATLRPEGKVALDELVTELGEIKYGSIRVIGHTDRIGENDYNQALSERRASAVKNYLARRSVPAERIEAVGKGKSQPTAETSKCNGPKSPKVVKCLQPDRRVDIEVAGTKDSTTGAR